MEKTEKMIEKIRKIMELAERGSTEEERDTAMLQAQKLLDKYNLTMGQIAGSSADVKYTEGISSGIHIGQKSSKMEDYTCAIISRYYNVEFINVRRQGERTLKLFGQKHNVNIAAYMHPWLMMEFDHRWNIYKMENSLKGTKYKNTFMYGLYSGLSDKLRAQREAMVKEHTGSTDLAVLDESTEIMNFIKSQMNIKEGKAAKIDIKDWAVATDGKIAGASINLNTQVEG